MRQHRRACSGECLYHDFHVLPLSCADLVLGVQWLKSLGLVLTDYNDLMIRFFHADKVIELKGDRDEDIGAINTHQP